jgi:hypothetical protein
MTYALGTFESFAPRQGLSVLTSPFFPLTSNSLAPCLQLEDMLEMARTLCVARLPHNVTPRPLLLLAGLRGQLPSLLGCF